MDKDDLKIIFGVSSVLLFILAVVIAFDCMFNYKTCQNINEVSGRKTEWFFFGGCFVEVDNDLVPKDNWIVYEKNCHGRKTCPESD